MKKLSDYVPRLKQLPNNAQFATLAQKSVLVIQPVEAELVPALLDASAGSLVVVGPWPAPLDDARVKHVQGDFLDLCCGPFDHVFFDARQFEPANAVSSITRFYAHLRDLLSPTGAVFAMLRVGLAEHGFDVLNSIVHVSRGVLPTQAYLFDEVLCRWSVRMMDGAAGAAPHEAIRFVRLAPKRPTLLLVLGRSQAGKTSLAREFQRLDRSMHVSNDYIYIEIVRKKRAGLADDIPPALVERVGDGSGAACGQFNRALEADADLLQDYLGVVAASLPHDKQLISMDFDMVRPEQVELMKRFFDQRGYSVWVVQR
jgi:hypothetical protein